MNAGAVVDGLDRLFHKVKRRDVALRVSGHSVIIKKITMPVMTAAELAEQINWEAEQHIPFDVADVQIDYQVVTPAPRTRARWTCCWSRPRRKRSAISRTWRSKLNSSTHCRPRRVHRAELFRVGVRRAAARSDHRADARRRVAHHAQHLVAGNDRVHARHRRTAATPSPKRFSASSA